MMDEPGLRATLRHRLISFGTMEPRLRGLSLVALLILALSAAVVLGRDWEGGAIPAPGGNSISPIAFVAVLACLAFGVGYLLAGAFHANPVSGIIGLVAFTVLIREVLGGLLTLGAVDALSTVVAIAVYGLFVSIWGIGLWSLLSTTAVSGRTILRPLTPQLSASLTLVLGASILGIYLIAWWGFARVGVASALTSRVVLQLFILSDLVGPVLFLAGSDFAELGDVAGRAVAERLRWLKSTRLQVAVAAVLATALLADAAYVMKGRLFTGLIAGVLMIGILFGLSRLIDFRGAGRMEVPLVALVAGTILFEVIIRVSFGLPPALLLPFQTPTIPMAHYVHPTDPAFALDYPSSWKPQILSSPEPLFLDIQGPPAGSARFILLTGAGGQNDAQTLLPAWLNARYPNDPSQIEQGPRQPPWQVSDFTVRGSTNQAIKGRSWVKAENGRVWFLYGESAASVYSTELPVFGKIAASWSSNAAAASAPAPAGPSFEQQVVQGGLYFAVAAAISTVGLLLVARRRRLTVLGIGSFFLAFFAAFNVLRVSDYLLNAWGLFHQLPRDSLPSLSRFAVQATVAAASLAVLGWLQIRRRARPMELIALLIALNVGIGFLNALLFAFGSFPQTRYQLSLLQAALVLCALLWDVAMSGKEITNTHGKWIPRYSRVLLFFGYELLVVSLIVFSVAQHSQSTGAIVHDQASIDNAAQQGMLILGPPLLIIAFVLRLRRREALP